MTNPMVFFSMATSAKSNQIVNSIIPEFSFSSSAFPVNMVNMQIIFLVEGASLVISIPQSGQLMIPYVFIIISIRS